MKLVGAGLVVLVLAGATPASAAPPTDAAATAEVLFREAREMMARGDNAAACPKLAESQRIDPSVGTLLNLGDCYERIGRTASAWATFNDAAAMAIRAEQPERARFAKGRAEALGPKLARLTVEVRASAQGLTVERDGVALGAATWAAALPVDPGPHTLVAKAPHRKTWSTTVSCKEGAAAVVVVPELESVTESAAAGSAPAGDSDGDAEAAARARHVRAAARHHAHGSRWRGRGDGVIVGPRRDEQGQRRQSPRVLAGRLHRAGRDAPP